jgi:hypothetical protein
MIIANEINYYKKGNDIREIEVEISQPILNDKVWECRLTMNGYGIINQNLYGQSSMQALSFALQHAKFNLVQLIDDGYNYYDKENDKEISKEKTLELLDAIYGHGTLLDDQHKKAIHLQVIKRLQVASGTEEDQDADINYLKKEFADPEIINYIYHSNPEMSASEIYKKAIAYKLINL